MTAGHQQWERRSAVRYPRPGKVWWRREDDDGASPGWMTDESRSGMAFVASSAESLAPGELISVARSDPRRPRTAFDPLRVSRVEPYGPDHRLVACTRFI